jgi:hypothetical protein
MYTQKRIGYYTNLQTDKDNDLIITLNRKNAKGMSKERKIKSEDEVLQDLLEDHLSNGLDWIYPEDVGALTNSPIISDVAEYNDQGELISCDYLWWFPNYQVTDLIKELFKTGKLVFTYEKAE